MRALSPHYCEKLDRIRTVSINQKVENFLLIHFSDRSGVEELKGRRLHVPEDSIQLRGYYSRALLRERLACAEWAP